MRASCAGRVVSARRGLSDEAGATMTGGAPQDLAPCIAAIHAKPTQAVVWATGGGFQAGPMTFLCAVVLCLACCAGSIIYGEQHDGTVFPSAAVASGAEVVTPGAVLQREPDLARLGMRKPVREVLKCLVCGRRPRL